GSILPIPYDSHVTPQQPPAHVQALHRPGPQRPRDAARCWAARPALSSRARRCGRGLIDQEILALFALLDRVGHPAWHCTTASPSFSAGTTIFGRDFLAFHRAAATPTAASPDARVFVERG